MSGESVPRLPPTTVTIRGLSPPTLMVRTPSPLLIFTATPEPQGNRADSIPYTSGCPASSWSSCWGTSYKTGPFQKGYLYPWGIPRGGRATYVPALSAGPSKWDRPSGRRSGPSGPFDSRCTCCWSPCSRFFLACRSTPLQKCRYRPATPGEFPGRSRAAPLGTAPVQESLSRKCSPFLLWW